MLGGEKNGGEEKGLSYPELWNGEARGKEKKRSDGFT